MYTIKVEGQEPFELKTKMTEFTLKEFQEISSILNDPEIDSVDKYLDVISYLGCPEDVLVEIDSDEFLEIVNTFTADRIQNKELTRTIEIDNDVYEAYPEGKEFKLKAKDFSLIEKCIKRTPNKYILEVIAILFKRTDLTRVENYAKAHIKHKKKLFADQIADQYYPYVAFIHDKISKKVKSATDKQIDLEKDAE